MTETIAADDITGRNCCPVWKRLTALSLLHPFHTNIPFDSTYNDLEPEGELDKE
jgi:hypothetical protein